VLIEKFLTQASATDALERFKNFLQAAQKDPEASATLHMGSFSAAC
jgi:hypothetical protein